MNNNILYSCVLTSITSSIITHPIDVIKVKYQTSTNNNIFRHIITKINHEGIKFLYKGSFASLLRNGVFVSSKLYTYQTLKFIKEPKHFHDKMLYGMSAGFVGSAIGTPFDTIMVKMQNNNKQYPTTISTINTIFKNNGFSGFWNATQYTVCRGIIVTSCQFSVFEQIKFELNSKFDNKNCIFITSSVLSSICSAIVSNPIDVCKTRRMNSSLNYKMMDIIQNESFFSLWKGVLASSFRQIPLNLIRFSLLDFYTKLFT